MFRYASIICWIFFSIHLCVYGSRSKSLFASRHEIPWCSSSGMQLQDKYDIVVLGAGAAGSIVSAKLATALDLNILLVEAGVKTGNNDNNNIADPALWLNVVHNDTLEWHFRTVTQTALNGRMIDLGAAKGTGGSAMHNAMGYVRGGRKW